LQTNFDWLLERIRNFVPGVGKIILIVEENEEKPLEDWENQKAVWLEIFQGRIG